MKRLVITRLRSSRKFRTWDLALPSDVAPDDAAMEILNSFNLRDGNRLQVEVQLNPDLSGGIFAIGGLQVATVEVA